MGSVDPWQNALRAAATLTPHEIWRANLAREVRSAAGGEFAFVMTCPPGDFLHGSSACDPGEFEHLYEEHVLQHVLHAGLPAPVCAPLDDLPLPNDFVTEYRACLLRNGVRGYVLGFMTKDEAVLGTIAVGASRPSGALLGAVQDGLARVCQVASTTATSALALAAGFQKAPRDPRRMVAVLTSRESEIVSLLCEGLSDLTIGARLRISEDTVGTHVRHVYRKLGVHTRAELVGLMRGVDLRAGRAIG